MGRHFCSDRLSTEPWRLAAPRFISYAWNGDWSRRDRSPDCVLSAKPLRLPSRSSDVGRCLRLLRGDLPQLLCGRIGRLHDGDHCQRLPRSCWWRQWPRTDPCDRSRQRNLHWHRLCWHCSRRDRFRRRAVPVGCANRRRRRGGHWAICRHVLFSGAGAVGNAVSSARARCPRHRTRSRHRRDDRRDCRPALSAARVASGCRRPVCSDLRLARGRH